MPLVCADSTSVPQYSNKIPGKDFPFLIFLFAEWVYI